MKIFDSDFTLKGTKRKNLYVKSSRNSEDVKKRKEAMRQAFIDMTVYKNSLSQEKELKPYRRHIPTGNGNERELELQRKEIKDAIDCGHILEPICKFFQPEIRPTPKYSKPLLPVTTLEAKLYGFDAKHIAEMFFLRNGFYIGNK
jgi:hypothetical protein